VAVGEGAERHQGGGDGRSGQLREDLQGSKEDLARAVMNSQPETLVPLVAGCVTELGAAVGGLRQAASVVAWCSIQARTVAGS
ncbi:hypothetical protein LCE32_29040, partial [Streptomyces sp. 7G]|nr:hypothetical protein [Streptomyces sp. 7G]